MVFDLEKGSKLHIDLAKSNSRSKRSRTGILLVTEFHHFAPSLVDLSVNIWLTLQLDDERRGSDKRAKGSSSFSRGISDPGVGSVHMPGLSNSAYNTIGYPSAQSHGSLDGRAANSGPRSRNSSAPPCPTIFVANLGPACTEQELIQVFSRCRGYLKLKVQSTYGTPVAFVDFADTACSTEALNHLQGTVLYSSISGEGMRLEFSLTTNLGLLSQGWECEVKSLGNVELYNDIKGRLCGDLEIVNHVLLLYAITLIGMAVPLSLDENLHSLSTIGGCG
ncbi:nucleotide-binding alpha-beta plait domain-containing protein [Tanacetum coccineum]